jgi:hypothetical protein
VTISGLALAALALVAEKQQRCLKITVLSNYRESLSVLHLIIK